MSTGFDAERYLFQRLGHLPLPYAHCVTVGNVAARIATWLGNAGLAIDPDQARAAGLLHDIGHCITSDLTHGYRGWQLLRADGVPADLARPALSHTLAGLTPTEAASLGLPELDMRCASHLERVVVVANCFCEGHRVVPPMDHLRKLQTRHAGSPLYGAMPARVHAVWSELAPGLDCSGLQRDLFHWSESLPRNLSIHPLHEVGLDLLAALLPGRLWPLMQDLDYPAHAEAALNALRNLPAHKRSALHTICLGRQVVGYLPLTTTGNQLRAMGVCLAEERQQPGLVTAVLHLLQFVAKARERDAIVALVPGDSAPDLQAAGFLIDHARSEMVWRWEKAPLAAPQHPVPRLLVRPAHSVHRHRLAELMHLAYLGTPDERYGGDAAFRLRELAAVFAGDDGAYLAPCSLTLVDDQQPVGCILVKMWRARRQPLVTELFIHPDYRRQGLARFLLQTARQRLAAHGFGAAYLWVTDDNGPALQAYISEGFQVINGYTQGIWRNVKKAPAAPSP